jgi:hypothetical protein
MKIHKNETTIPADNRESILWRRWTRCGVQAVGHYRTNRWSAVTCRKCLKTKGQAPRPKRSKR